VLKLLKTHGVDTVMHFAAYTVVPESVQDPLKYYRNNTCATRTLLECCQEAGVRHFVFSSTAAVYGVPADGFAAESTPPAPINPYGVSKLMCEWMLASLAQATPLRYAALRYFNVAGSHSSGRIGQATPNATLLIKVACEHAVGKRVHVTIYGTDYPTADGTGVRDYIHVEDLAAAHVSGALRLAAGPPTGAVYNVGTGRGYSVLEVIERIRAVTGQPLDYRIGPRRPGDPPAVVADAGLIRRELGWQAGYDLTDMIESTWRAWSAVPAG
jgi:UDP-glucose 4-epimerase